MAHQIVVQLPQVEFIKPVDKKSETLPLGARPQVSNATPIIVNFQRLLSNPKLQDVIPGINNRDLFHAVVASYDQSLPDVTEDIIYASVHDKLSRTILIVQELDDALEDFKQRALSKLNNVANTKKKKSEKMTCLDHGDEIDQKLEKNSKEILNSESLLKSEIKSNDKTDCSLQNHVSETPNETFSSSSWANKDSSNDEESRFANIFSDMESSDSENENDEDNENYLEGVDDFIKNVRRRKEEKERWLTSIKVNDCLGEPYSLLGIEDRLMACATFEQSYDKPGHKVIQLTLIATRKRFRKLGIGRFMTRIIKNPALVGRYDVVVVNADFGATDFFEKEGFSDDVILNSKYLDIGDTWYNCKRMCYLPPYQSNYESTTVLSQSATEDFAAELDDIDLKQMELDLALYQEKSLQAFQAQTVIVQRLRKEVILLRARVGSQHDQIQMLTKENHRVRDEKYACEKELLKLKLSTMTNAADKLLNFSLDLNSDEENLEDL